ncbi:MAG: 3-phosphoshikimate 1-carboxyvinyltransferase, partial [Candidatus Scatosoma sp.]
MNVRIEKSRLQGEITAPPSKSVAHRFLLAAALAEGNSAIDNVALSADIRATLSCVESLGARVVCNESSSAPQRVEVYGTGGNLRINGDFLCNESGSTLRFLLPLALCALSRRENAVQSGDNAPTAVFYGAPRLIERGVGVYEEIFSAASFQKETFPRRRENAAKNAKITVSGAILPAKYAVRGNISSQFVTGLFYALPLLDGDSEVKIIPPFESASYISLTLSVLQQAGVNVEKTAENVYFIRGNQRFKSGNFNVEGDWSNAA